MSYTDADLLGWVDRAMKANATMKKLRYELGELHDEYHSGLGAALPVNLSDIKNGEHSAAGMTSTQITAGVFDTGETVKNFLKGGVTISGIFLDPATDTPIDVKTPLGHLGNLFKGSGPY